MDDEAVVCAGSYEGGLHGWTVDPETLELRLKFSFGAHTGCVRCVSARAAGRTKGGRRGMLVSGGDDEMLRVYSLTASCQSRQMVPLLACTHLRRMALVHCNVCLRQSSCLHSLASHQWPRC